MNVRIEDRDGRLLAHVEDTQIGAESADELKSRIVEKLPATQARLAIDLTRIEFMDSSGLGALVSLLKTVRPSGEIVLYGMRPSVLEIFRLTHLDSVFPCQPDESSALAFLAEASETMT